MERDYIGLNVVNFFTIGLMAFAGMALIGFAASLLRQYLGVSLPAPGGASS